MEFSDLIAARHSIRMFEPTPVEPERLRAILDASNRAPSAGNLQAFEIYVVIAESDRAALTSAALGQGFITQAPVALVFCAHAARSAPRYGTRGEHLYAVQDATIAATYAMLAATDAGLSTVWVGAFDDAEVWRAIGSPEGHHPVAILPIGHAAESPRVTARRALDELVHNV